MIGGNTMQNCTRACTRNYSGDETRLILCSMLTVYSSRLGSSGELVLRASRISSETTFIEQLRWHQLLFPNCIGPRVCAALQLSALYRDVKSTSSSEA